MHIMSYANDNLDKINGSRKFLTQLGAQLSPGRLNHLVSLKLCQPISIKNAQLSFKLRATEATINIVVYQQVINFSTRDNFILLHTYERRIYQLVLTL